MPVQLLILLVAEVGSWLLLDRTHLGRRVYGLGVNELATRFIDALLAALAEADVVWPHVPLTGSTRGLIGAAALGYTRPRSILLNAARGRASSTRSRCSKRSGQGSSTAPD